MTEAKDVAAGRVRQGCPDFPGTALQFMYSYLEGEVRVGTGHLTDADLPTVGDVADALHDPMLLAQAVRVVTEGVTQPASAFSRETHYNSRKVLDSLDSRALRLAYAAGSTVIVEDLAKWQPRVAAICNTIFNDRWLYANAAYFLTGSGNRGLPFHADEEMTYVFQLSGMKTWQVADCAEDKLGASDVPAGSRIAEFALRPGDVACIPAMFPHRTEAASGGDSVHLTIGVRPFKLKDFIADVAERGITRIPTFEAHVPSVEDSADVLRSALSGGALETWQREVAIASVRLASGSADRGFEFGAGNADVFLPATSTPSMGDLVWRVRLGERSLVQYSGAFAMMDDAGLDSLLAATELRRTERLSWKQLKARGCVIPAVERFLTAAGWSFGDGDSSVVPSQATRTRPGDGKRHR